MIEINEIMNEEREFNEGLSVSPDWVTNDRADNEWTLHTTESALKELRRIKRMKGRKSYSITLDFGDHLSACHASWRVTTPMVSVKMWAAFGSVKMRMVTNGITTEARKNENDREIETSCRGRCTMALQ